MPAFIAPIEHTRNFSLKPATGLRFGNFEGVVNLPPVIKNNKLGEHSFSTLNNQQIYKTVCEWYEGWRAWQQKVLLCGIVDRCSMRQVDILATTLEPIRHRDYVVAARHSYPVSPLKKTRDGPPGTQKKKKKVKKKRERPHEDKDTAANTGILTFPGEDLPGAVTPESVIEPDPTFFTPRGDSELLRKLTFPHESSENQMRTKEFTIFERDYSSVSGFADNLASKIMGESLPRSVSMFDPSELYAQDLASSILQQALNNVGTLMNEKAKTIETKPTIKGPVVEHTNIDSKNTNVKDYVDKRKNKNDDNILIEKPPRVKSRADLSQPIDFTLLDKYKKYTPPPKPKRVDEDAKKAKSPKSLVRLLIPDDDLEDAEGQGHDRRVGSAHSGLSKSLSVITRSSLEHMRYKLFGAQSIATPDFFKTNGVTKLPGGQQHLRYGNVRQPYGLPNIPIPVARMYKNVKWWTDGDKNGKIMLKAQKEELKMNFKEQLEQVWAWMSLWEDYEKIVLLKELLKLCAPEDLNFLCSHLQQKLRDTRDINRLPDKLLLYIFSYLDADKIHKAQRVCRRWRFLCATDDLWMVKCHELGLKEGIKNLEKMIVKAKGYRMVIDWRMAYEELQRITQMMKVGFIKKKTKTSKKARNVDFKEELERLKNRDDDVPVISQDDIISDISESEVESESSKDETSHRKFEFRNKVDPRHDARGDSLTQDELHSMLKRLLFEPEEAEKKRAESRGTPEIVELEVLRGTFSSIRRQEKGQGQDDGESVISEDLREYDDEFKLQWEERRIARPERVKVFEGPPTEIDEDLTEAPEDTFDKVKRMQKEFARPERVKVVEGPPTEIDENLTEASEDTLDKVKRMQKGPQPSVGLSILKKRRPELMDDGDAEDAAFDIRPELMPVDDIMGKAKSHMSLQWHQIQKKRREQDDDDYDDDYYRPKRTPRFVGEVKSVLRARKLQGHMSGIMCIQYDKRRLISAGLDRVIRMWDIRSGRSLHKFYGHKGGIRCLVFAGNELLTGSWDTTIMVWDLRNLCRKYILTDHTDSVNCLTMNNDFVVSGSDDCTVRVWRRASYLCINVLRGHKAPITSLAFDGTNVISGSMDKTLRMCNIITADCIRTFTDCDEPILSVTMKGSLVLSSDTTGRVHFWNKLNGECEAAIQAHQEPVNKMAYLEGRFYTASADWSIREWDLVTMTSVRVLQGHKGAIKDLKVTSDRIVSCSEDGSIRIWDLFDPRKKTTVEDQVRELHHEPL